MLLGLGRSIARRGWTVSSLALLEFPFDTPGTETVDQYRRRT